MISIIRYIETIVTVQCKLQAAENNLYMLCFQQQGI